MSADVDLDLPLYADPELQALAQFLFWCNRLGYILCKRHDTMPHYVPAFGSLVLLIDRYAREREDR